MIECVDYRWSGQVMESIDGLAYIGANPMDAPNVFVATGDCGMGMTHGTIAGMLLTALILGNDHPWRRLYDPSRLRVKSLGELTLQNLNVTSQYKDWLLPGEEPDLEGIPRGSGAVICRGLSRVAVYRDENGSLEALSAICPHLGCVVNWNSVEQTWDCPCHGSRFDRAGRVLNGPAISGLEPAAIPTSATHAES
jgi:Rieske Fe-S protein